MAERDVVVVGASAGGVEAMRSLMAGLPADLPAAVLVVLHLPPSGSSALARILDRAGPLSAEPPADGQHLKRGRVYVAPPDHHLLVLEAINRRGRTISVRVGCTPLPAPSGTAGAIIVMDELPPAEA